MQILAIISGEYGKRHVANVREKGPDSWVICEWQAPAVLPPVIDYPEDYLPEQRDRPYALRGVERGLSPSLPAFAQCPSAEKSPTRQRC